MIKLTARIQIFNSGGEISNVYTNATARSNSANIESVANTRIKNENAFVFGYSKLGNRPQLKTSTKPAKYFISKERTKNDKTFEKDIEIYFNKPQNTNTITIVFDDIENCFPTEFKIQNRTGTTNSQIVKTDDAICTISYLQDKIDYVIKISSLNKANAPLVVRGIYADLSIDLDYRNLTSISGKIFDRSDINLPSFGIISNSGNIEFNDTDGEILDYIENGWLQEGLEVKMWLTNTLANNKQTKMGTYTTANWSYDNDNRSVSVSLVDNLVEWQDIHIEGFSYDPRNPNKVLANKTMKDLYQWLRGQTPTKYRDTMKFFSELDTDTQTHLSSIVIEYPYLESANLWSQWNKFCQATQTHIYKDYEGNIVCKYNGGN